MANFTTDFNADNGDDSDFSLYLSSSDESDSEDATSDEVQQTVTRVDTWTTGVNLSASPKLDFTGPLPGPTVSLPEGSAEIDFVTLFFKVELLGILVKMTNLYAEQLQARNGSDQNWSPVTEKEMKAWLGMRVYMSVLQLPNIDLYWTEDYLFGGLRVANIMTRDRFNKISQYFHVADDRTQVGRGQPGHDKLQKVRDMLEMVRRKCLQNYHLHENTSIDEAMVAFRGRLGFRQYLPAKPTKYGIKVWMRADPENGYVNDFQVYTGKEGTTSEGGLGTRVVMDLIAPITNRNHIVNCDNYFMSPHLCSELLKVGTYARGTVSQLGKGFRRRFSIPSS